MESSDYEQQQDLENEVLDVQHVNVDVEQLYHYEHT
jgi:hypothetical protein